VPEGLARLLQQHPAAIRTLLFQSDPLGSEQFGHLEIETKHGHVALIDHATGEVFANPPKTPNAGHARRQRDLTGHLPGAFDGRPVIQSIETTISDGKRSGYHFTFSTGSGFSFTLDPLSPLVLPDNY
jgi:hypothetical protein